MRLVLIGLLFLFVLLRIVSEGPEPLDPMAKSTLSEPVRSVSDTQY